MEALKQNDQYDENGQYSLLVVDDNEMNRSLMQIQLTRKGYSVTTAEGGPQALNLMAETDYDLVLLDIMMPGMNGLEVLEIIRKKHSLLNLPVIMVTADDLQESIVDAMQRGANDYLIKPLNMPVTIARIKSQLTSKHLANLKDEFVRFASHDLKKPLIVIEDVVDTLLNECKAGTAINDDVPELLGLIRKTGENMEKIISGFLDTTKLNPAVESLAFSPTQLNVLVERSIQANNNYAQKKGIRLKCELDKHLPVVDIEEFKITQVLDNLIGNALKFSPQDTSTTIKTHADEQYVYAEIVDEGPGLTVDDMSKLFVKNAELSNKPTGGESSTGVGLHLSKQFVESHKGKIGARNNHTSGTTFWFRLPITHK